MRSTLVVAFTFVLALVGGGCGGPASMEEIRHRETGIHYRFESSKWVNKKTNECERIEVRVRAKAKLYTNAKKPPSRLTIIDSDCELPFDVERARYYDNGGVFVTGSAMDQFRFKYRNLFQELYSHIDMVLSD